MSKKVDLFNFESLDERLKAIEEQLRKNTDITQNKPVVKLQKPKKKVQELEEVKEIENKDKVFEDKLQKIKEVKKSVKPKKKVVKIQKPKKQAEEVKELQVPVPQSSPIPKLDIS